MNLKVWKAKVWEASTRIKACFKDFSSKSPRAHGKAASKTRLKTKG